MSQNVNLAFSGIWTAPSDFNGTPPGSLKEADNMECRYKNIGEPRRGFDDLPGSYMAGVDILRSINFPVLGTEKILELTDTGALLYYTGATPSPAVPGSYSTGIVNPDSTNAKSRFLRAGQNLYLTSQDGIRSLSSGTSAQILRAGVPKGLDLQAATNGAVTGFLNNNVAASTTANTAIGSPNLTQFLSTTSIVVGQYVAGTGIPAGTKVLSITSSSTVLVETGDTTAGNAVISNLTSITGVSTGTLVSGPGIPTGAKVVSTAGAGPYTATLNLPAYETQTGAQITFSSSVIVVLDANATANGTGVALSFYTGSQVAYRVLFGRVETSLSNGTITRVGAPSQRAIATNTTGFSTNVSVTATLPKNSVGLITFVQVFRSEQTPSAAVPPLEEYKLVYERALVAGDFTARTITFTDQTPDSQRGLPLYAGNDRETLSQANDPPPMAWDMCVFRDFMLYVNCTQPSTLKFTVLSVGAPSGVQIGDVITISGTLQGVAYSRTYTGAVAENASLRQFQIVTSGTPSQNITDTVNSLIRVINYDNALQIHAILLSGPLDLPGQVLLEMDNPSLDTFHVTASAHTTAYDPALSSLTSDLNIKNNLILVSKAGELEAVPALNQYFAGTTDSPILRVIALRDYAVVIKKDGNYKIAGTTPQGLTVTTLDLTAKNIGADTAVALNSAVWMLSDQGVVKLSDSGVEGVSIPIDDQLNTLIGSNLVYLNQNSFAVGFESDRKYILCVPSIALVYSDLQYNFNYVTGAWTTWSRNLNSAFVHSVTDRLYISRADVSQLGMSLERDSGTYKDYVDEPYTVSLTAIDVTGKILTLLDASTVSVGDIVYVDSTHFSLVEEVDLTTEQITIETALTLVVGSITILKSYLCTITWNRVFGDNPAFVRQFQEGLLLFKNTRFKTASISFVTDFSKSFEYVPLLGVPNGTWGFFGWGNALWGGQVLPDTIRFYVPANKQLGSYLIPTLRVQNGFSDFRFQGMSISYVNVSQEVGK